MIGLSLFIAGVDLSRLPQVQSHRLARKE